MSSDAAASPFAGAPGELVVADTELEAGAIGFWGNMVQAVTHIAPGLNVLLGLTFIVSFAGVTAPIAYLLGGIICLGVAVVLTQLAKDRKSTRLNSSHSQISYAVFCLKKKKKTNETRSFKKKKIKKKHKK